MTIKQTTASDVLTVLKWVVENPHHISSACDAKHPDCMVLKGHHAKLVIKPEIMKEAYDHLIYSHNIRRFDTRMYLPNAIGIRLLSNVEDISCEEVCCKYSLKG